jgi:HEAT repeat protein
MGATVGDQVVACARQDFPVLAGEPSRATLLSILGGRPGTARIWRAAARCFAAAIVLLTAFSFVSAQNVAPGRGGPDSPVRKLVLGLDGCPDLPACLAILDAFVSSPNRGQASEWGPAIAKSFRRFGEPAKQELLRRAFGDHPGWRDLAVDILLHWGWSPADVPALRAALRLQDGEWVARPLVEIGTPEAIEALKDLAVADWVLMAANLDNPRKMRLAALLGLEAMGEGVGQQGKDLVAALADPDEYIRSQTLRTLAAIRDPSVVTTVAGRCKPSGKAFYRMTFEARECLMTVAAFGKHARIVGSDLMKFLASPNGEDVASAVTVLGYIGYDAAIPQIEQQLRSPDWRVVYAAARSLGWLGAGDSIAALKRVAIGHWLPEVREQVQAAVDALKEGEKRLAQPPSFDGRRLFFVGFTGGAARYFGVDTLRIQPLCNSRRWEWNGIQFSQPTSSTRSLTLGAGVLVGKDRGEFGGDLAWRPTGGEAQLLHKLNVVAIVPAEGGAIVLVGYRHMNIADGYAVRVSQRGDGGWSLSELARLPSTADALAAIRPNLFAAWSENRVVVFSDQEIVGLAKCVDN